MKRLLISCLLVFALVAPALAMEPIDFSKPLARMGMVMGPGVAGAAATPYCTAAATCTATTPGECDIACEDFEGASACYSGDGGNNCRSADRFAAITTTGGAVDTKHSLTAGFTCNDKGSYGIEVDKTGNAAVNARLNFSALTATYVQFWVNPTVSGVTDGNCDKLASIINSGGVEVFYLQMCLVGTTLSLKSQYHNGATYTASGSTTITAGNWYRIRMNFVTASASPGNDGVAYFAINDTVVVNNAAHDSEYQPTRFYFGAFTTGCNCTYTAEYDNLAIDNDTTQGTCN